MTDENDKHSKQEAAKEHDAANGHGHKNGNGNGSHLGMAGRMAQAFVHSPLTPLLFLAMLAMGIMGLIVTPRQEDPQISVPMIDVYVKFPGASAQEVASLAIEPLERIMSEIPGVKHVYAAAEREQGLVIVRFVVGEALGPSIVKVHDKIQSNLDKIPPGVEHPLVKPVGIDDVPVVTLTLWSEHLDQGQIRTLANDILQRLKEVPDTGAGFVVGGLREQIRVQVRPERLSGFSVSLDQVAHTIRTANSEQKAGSTESYGQHFTVYTGSFLQTVQDVANLVVTTREGAPVYVRDIATVTEEPEEPKSLVSYYTGKEYPGEAVARGQPAVTIALAKKIGSNGVEVANNILAKIDALKHKDLGLITPDIHVEVTRNYGKTADDKVTSLIKKLFIATGAVTILVWLALGWRPAFVVTLVIPVVLLMTIFAAWMGGFTIDRVSLFALIFSIGILVDDAIVVIENIYRRWLMKGETDTETVIDAVREVGNPTILATFTVVAALMPMAFVTGLMGPYMSPIPALGSVAMILSLFAAFVFVPYLAMRVKPGMNALKKAEESEERDKERIALVFDKVLVPLIDSRRKGNIFLIALIATFFFVCMFFIWKWVPVKMLPYDNKPEFSVVINMPSGSALPATANLTSKIAERMRSELPHITAIQTYVGAARPFDFNGMVRHYYMRNKPWHAEIQVQLKDKTERDESSHELAVMARQIVDEVAGDYNRRHRQGKGVRTTVVEMPPGPPVLQTVVAEIYGPDKDTRQHAARMMTHIFENTEGMADIDNYLQDDYETWRFEV
ncbi:MAG: efflux RND transporter permease subunit, partial [Gammaproteobacteria bacterium]